MEVKCDYCDGYFDDTLENCTHCGAQNNHIRRVTDTTPKTIEELKQWYIDRKLPPSEVTRFFIGVNYTEPRAFGIYQDGEKFVVYKNKDTGERAIRYEGTDEAYAVNELYLKLKSEILNQKALNSNSGKANSGSKTKPSKKDGLIGFLITAGVIGGIVAAELFKGLFYALLIALAVTFVSFVVTMVISKGKINKKLRWPIFLAVFAVSFTVAFIPLKKYYRTSYYNYNDTVYCYYQGSYYEYYDDDYWPVEYSSLPSDFSGNMPDYEYTWQEDSWEESKYEFTSSDYYNDNIATSDSDSSYDWDSGSSWDSGGSDWGSDWLRNDFFNDFYSRR